LPFQQNTNVLSYYIIKCCFLININDFIEYLEKSKTIVSNNDDIFVILQKTVYINDIIAKIQLSLYLDNSMRMTCIE